MIRSQTVCISVVAPIKKTNKYEDQIVRILKLITLPVLAIALIGCGGGSGDSGSPTPTPTPTPTPVPNTPAQFEGLSATVASNTTESLTGAITITDPDAGEEAFTVLNGIATSYGTFSIDTNGNWTYDIDDTNLDITNLHYTASLEENIAIESVDGTPASLDITVNGTRVASNVAKITDNMADDTGELRYKLPMTIDQGKLAITFLKESGTTIKGSIALFGSTTLTDEALISLDLRDGYFEIHNRSDISVTIPYELDRWVDLEISWDATAASVETSTAPLISVSINGESVTTEPFASASTTLTSVVDGVRKVSVKMGAKTSIVGTPALYVDDIAVYSGSDSLGFNEVWWENFEFYNIGFHLDPDDDPASPFDSYSAEAVVDIK